MTQVLDKPTQEAEVVINYKDLPLEQRKDLLKHVQRLKLSERISEEQYHELLLELGFEHYLAGSDLAQHLPEEA